MSSMSNGPHCGRYASRRQIAELIGREALDRVVEHARRYRIQARRPSFKELLDQVEDYRIQRLFDAKGKLLPIFWYIAIIGYLLTLTTLYLPPPTTKRCLLVSLYSSMVAVVLLGIFILTHPYSEAAGVGPDIFEWLLIGAS